MLGPPASLYFNWRDTVQRLRRYLTGWWQYFRYGESFRVFAKLDHFVRIRVARSVARAQPRGKRRRQRRWQEYLPTLTERRYFPCLVDLQKSAPRQYRRQVNVPWRAV